jgi:flagellin
MAVTVAEGTEKQPANPFHPFQEHCMSAVLNTNVASLWASKNLLGAQSKLAGSVERLSSGLRINRARDDAAGLGVANSLTAQINGANQGVRNLNDAISMVQTAEGAIAAASEMGQRILMLATQGANGTLGSDEKAAIQSEMQQLIKSIDAIGGRTEFSGNPLLSFDTSASEDAALYTMQISNSADDKVELSSEAFKSVGSLDEVGGSGEGQATALLDAIDAIDPDASAADTTAAFQLVQTEAQAYVVALGTQRSLLGAYQNQMEYTLSNITELSSNLQSARSRVIDTDYASETASLTKGQILQQAATAMLAQANQMPNVILTLLK